MWFRSILELNCFLSFVSFVLRHSFSITHRRNGDFVVVTVAICMVFVENFNNHSNGSVDDNNIYDVTRVV